MSWWAEKKNSYRSRAAMEHVFHWTCLKKNWKNNIKNHKQTISKCDSIFGINKPNLLFVNGNFWGKTRWNFETCNLSNAKNMQKPFHCSVLQIWQRFSTWRFQRHLRHPSPRSLAKIRCPTKTTHLAGCQGFLYKEDGGKCDLSPASQVDLVVKANAIISNPSVKKTPFM